MVLVQLHDEHGATLDVATRRASRASTRRGVASPRVADSPSFCGKKKFAHSKTKEELQFATWNVRSLLNVSGPVETAFARGVRTLSGVDDRRIDVVVGELQRLGIEVAGLEETRWFGDASYVVGDALVLTSGRPLPSDGAALARGEGVAVVLRGRALRAWKAGGSQWSAVSSRLGVAQLRMSYANAKQLSLHVVVCYAPTFRSTRVAKDQFYADLQQVLRTVPRGDKFIVLGDFNARIGSRSAEHDEWDAVRGPHGFGVCNDAGKELLNFLSLNNASICNTWFLKKPVYKQSWQHPMTKQWHAIDFIIVHQRDRKLCSDCRVICTADCGSDHRLVCLTWRLDRLRFLRHSNAPKRQRFNVCCLKRSPGSSATQQQAVCNRQQSFSAAVSNHLSSQQFGRQVGVEDQWQAIRTSLIRAGEQHLGFASRSQPDWFLDNQSVIAPLLQTRRLLYNKWVKSGLASDHALFKTARSKARAEIRRSKDRWLTGVAAEADLGRVSCHGRSVWSAIRILQRSYQGLQPTPTSAVRDEHGEMCASREAKISRWHRHFQKVLNVQSTFDPAVLSSLPQRPVVNWLADLPTLDELSKAIDSLTNNKAPGESSILPEMVKYAGPDFREALLVLVNTAWIDGCVPQAWRDAELVPIPKKGDHTRCDNWRGIALLDVVGKALGRLIQNRLQRFAEETLPDSQCGFRSGRSCTDQIFTASQIVEKLNEHRTSAFLIFVDLKKAYDSVPRAALWQCLCKLGIPSSLVKLIASFHTNMSASVRVEDTHTPHITVNNGLRQGCTMSPVLFNLFFAVVLDRWRTVMGQSCPEDEFFFNFNILDGNLFHRPASRRRASHATLPDLEFADDAMLITLSRRSAQLAVTTFSSVASSFGLTMNPLKTEFMCAGFGVSAADRLPLISGDHSVNHAQSFLYLGSLLSPDSRVGQEVDRRLASAARAFGALRCVFDDRSLSLKTKRLLYTACVQSILLYGAECWPTLKRDERRLDVFHHKCLRAILRVSRLDQERHHVTNSDLRQRWGDVGLMSDHLRTRRLQWLGHVARQPSDRVPKQLLFGWLPETRPAHGPRMRWKDRVTSDLRALAVDDWYSVAQDRLRWKTISRTLPKPPAVASPTVCAVCNRQFKSTSGLARHKCTAVRQLPVAEQPGARQCGACQRWFRSAGGLAVHVCSSGSHPTPSTPAGQEHPPSERSALTTLDCCSYHCNSCSRCFKSAPGFRRHNCARGDRGNVDRSGYQHVCGCGRRFRREQDLRRHKCHLNCN